MSHAAELEWLGGVCGVARRGVWSPVSHAVALEWPHVGCGGKLGPGSVSTVLAQEGVSLAALERLWSSDEILDSGHAVAACKLPAVLSPLHLLASGFTAVHSASAAAAAADTSMPVLPPPPADGFGWLHMPSAASRTCNESASFA